jgi:putative copper export protein
MMMDGPDALSAALRAVSFALLLNAAGIPFFIAAFGHLVPNSLFDVRKLGSKLAIAALAFVAAHQALEAARMAGEMSGITDPAMQKMALLSPAGATFGARILGLILVVAGLRPTPAPSGATAFADANTAAGANAVTGANPAAARGETMPGLVTQPPVATSANAIAVLGALMVITSFTLMGHTATNPHRAAAASLVILHLLVVAFWLGALWPLHLAAQKEQPATAGHLIERFSVTATWAVPLILLAGIGLSALLLPSLATFKQPYGQLLLAKLTAFAVLMAMAALNKWRFGPACAEGNTAAFQRTVVVEYVLICVVLTATAIMTTFFSPQPA